MNGLSIFGCALLAMLSGLDLTQKVRIEELGDIKSRGGRGMEGQDVSPPRKLRIFERRKVKDLEVHDEVHTSGRAHP